MKLLSQEKLILPNNLEAKIGQIRKEGKTIATLNGSFDLLHAGHLKIIHEASSLADCLIVALNSDASIKKYKSPLRPIIPLQHRLEMIAALHWVNFVTYFEETDPKKLLQVIKPDIHVNGSEYGEKCIEASIVEKNGGRMHIVSLKPNLSTSEIIEKIKSII